MVIMKIKNVIKNLLYKIKRKIYFLELRRGVEKKDLTIISNDCCGGVIYKQLGKKFCSPFVNLFLNYDDFIKTIFNLKIFLDNNVNQIRTNKNYPVGEIKFGDDVVKINFMHYSSFELAISKWEERKKRILYNKIIIVFNLTNELDVKNVEKYVSLMKECKYPYIILNRFISSKNVIKIKFSDLNHFEIGQIFMPERHPYRLHLDQIKYRKYFRF